MRIALITALLCAATVLAEVKGTPAKVTGWVMDSACAYTKGLKTPEHPECAIACAKKGSALIILRDDGTIFLPVEETMPAGSVNERLLPYAGKRVTATGRTYTRSGSHAMVIDGIEEAK